MLLPRELHQKREPRAFPSAQVINGGLLVAAAAAALGLSCWLVKSPPDVQKLVGPAGSLWSRLMAFGTAWAPPLIAATSESIKA